MRKAVGLILVLLAVCYGQLLMPNLVKQQAIAELMIDRKGVFQWLRGFSEGLEQDIDFNPIESCITSEISISQHLASAIYHFRQRTRKDIELALHELAATVSIIPKALQDCKVTVADFRTLLEMIQKIEDPGEFFWSALKNLVVHGVEIWSEVSTGLDYYRAGEFHDSGEQFGFAVSKLFFDAIPVSQVGLMRDINAETPLWTATDYPQFANLTLWDIKRRYLGLKSLALTEFPRDNSSSRLRDVPDHFDARKAWPKCTHDIRDQGKCGSCWAFGATEVVSERFCIASNGEIRDDLSPQFLVSCDKLNKGCKGGILALAWGFLIRKGTVTEGCWPYESEKGIAPPCNSFDKCHDGSELMFYHIKFGTVKYFFGPERIKEEIFANGPVETGFMVYADFLQYQHGIYQRTSTRYLGNHAVMIIGWGMEKGVRYWIAANSWSEKWGEEGYFRIKEGECYFDRAAIAGIPNLDALYTPFAQARQIF